MTSIPKVEPPLPITLDELKKKLVQDYPFLATPQGAFFIWEFYKFTLGKGENKFLGP